MEVKEAGNKEDEEETKLQSAVIQKRGNKMPKKCLTGRRKFNGKPYRFKAHLPQQTPKKKVKDFVQGLRDDGNYVRVEKYKRNGKKRGYSIWIRRK